MSDRISIFSGSSNPVLAQEICMFLKKPLGKATIKRFVNYCKGRHQLHDRCFSIRYETNIPRQVGLAGSSAIIVATLRALMEFYSVDIPERVQPSLALSVERDELGIAAGLQDRVIQVYGGMVSMDFSKSAMETLDELACGRYERLSLDQIPNLYVAYCSDFGEPTEVFHNNLRARYDMGEKAVVEAMDQFAHFAAEGKQALVENDLPRLAQLIDANYDLRASICQLPRNHDRMIQTARSAGASAKFAGSGGAIIGTYPDEDGWRRLKSQLESIGSSVDDLKKIG